MKLLRNRPRAALLPALAPCLLAAIPGLPAQEPDAGRSLAPFVPSPMEVVEKMLEMAEVRAGDVVFDLGCGDGRIVVAAAKERGARGVGVDLDPRRVEESRERARREQVEDRVEIRLGDALKVDLEPATVVTLYLLTDSNRRLKPVLEKLRPGARVVSHNYEVPGWKAVRSEQVKDSRGWNHSIFLYRVEASADLTGTWSWTEYMGLPLGGKKAGPEPRKTSLLLVQDGEKLAGSLRSGTGPRAGWRETPIEGGQVKDGELAFTAVLERGGKPETFSFKGTREGDSIRFIKEAEGFTEKWSARRDPVHPEGSWSWTVPGAGGPVATVLEVRPEAGGLSGLLDRKLPAEGLSVRGARIRFEAPAANPAGDGPSAGKASYRGVIDGDAIVGTFKDSSGKEHPWKALRAVGSGAGDTR